MSVLTAIAAAAAFQTAAPIEVPFRTAETAIIVDATLNGKKLSFMFDTGFSGGFVVDQDVNLGKATGAITLRDFVGEFQAETVTLKTVKVGEKPINKELTAVMQPADYTFSYRTHCDGIMGFEVVQDYVFEINFQRKMMIFHPKTLDITKRTPDNKKTFLAKLLPKGMGSMEMSVTTKNGQKMTLALDTGNSFFATTHKDVLERIGLWPADRKPQHMRSAFVASGAVDSWTAKMPELDIYGVPVPESYWSIIDLPSSSSEHDGTVGYGFLKNFNIIVDYERRRVWMENFTGETGNEPPGETGLVAFYDEKAGRTRIVRVAPDSPAAKAGIKLGDSLLAIDGKELLGAIGFTELEARLEGKVGSKVTVNISSGGELRRIELDRVALVNLIQ
jgi:predicted aspartyl protease